MGERHLKALRSCASPLADTIGPTSFVDLQRGGDAPFPRGRRHYWKASFLRRLDPAASVVTTFAGKPILVLETIGVVVQPFDAVDERFAFDEGEGDRSPASWRQAH